MAQGLVGTRKWVIRDPARVRRFVSRICRGHWPGNPNTVPIQVQVGPFDEKIKIAGGNVFRNTLPRYNATLVVAQYQLLMFQCVPWPHCIPRPDHPKGTTLGIRVRGSGQFLTMPPGVFRECGDYAKGAAGCDASKEEFAFTETENCRIIIPLTEYHITCDRLKWDQVPNWKKREGTVNLEQFLGEKPGTLLFDTWDIDHSFAPGTTTKNIVRYKLTCTLRSRDVPICQKRLKYAGWNEDYHKDHWVTVAILSKGRKTSEFRYPYVRFADLFTNADCKLFDEPCAPPAKLERIKQAVKRRRALQGSESDSGESMTGRG
jgi:hypothetical protein